MLLLLPVLWPCDDVVWLFPCTVRLLPLMEKTLPALFRYHQNQLCLGALNPPTKGYVHYI